VEVRQQRFSIGYAIAVFVALVAIQALFVGRHTETLTYSDFLQLVSKGKVSDLVIDDRSISGTLTPTGLEGLVSSDTIAELKPYGAAPHPFTTIRVEDPDLTRALTNANIRFSGRVDNPWFAALLGWVLPVLFFVGLWAVLLRGMRGHQTGMMAVGKSKARVYVERTTGVTFDDVAGIDEARRELMEIVDFLKNPQHYQRLGGKIPKGVLLVGEPGTGKTLLAKAVAGEAKVPFFSLSGSDFVEMFVGVGDARVSDLFAQAQTQAPSIVFIDELDALGKARGVSPVMGGHDEREQTLNQLLAEMDGFDTQKGVILMAATNRPEILDPALLRPGRFDRKVVVDRPDLRGREKILRVHVRHVALAPTVDLAAVAARTPGFVGADLANLVNEAALGAAREGKAAVELYDFEEAIDRIVAGLERRSKVINPREKRTVAHHEAGHALIAELRPRADRVARISIIPRGVAALGYTLQQPTEDRYLMTRSELLDRLDVLLGGRVAEELVFGDVSTGARDDLQRATDLARQMVTRYGMSQTIGLATVESDRTPLFLTMQGQPAVACSEETSRLIDQEVRQMLEDSRQRVRHDLDAQRPALDALAALLIEHEVVDRRALDALLAESPGTNAGPAGAEENEDSTKREDE